MVMNFSHEKSVLYKFILKNGYNSSPLIHPKGLRTKLEIIETGIQIKK